MQHRLRVLTSRETVSVFGWKPLDARRGQRPKPSERRREATKELLEDKQMRSYPATRANLINSYAMARPIPRLR
jgi:hypothetical protein